MAAVDMWVLYYEISLRWDLSGWLTLWRLIGRVRWANNFSIM